MKKIKSFLVDLYFAWVEHRETMSKKNLYRWY